jgi:hypothetical protein
VIPRRLGAALVVALTFGTMACGDDGGGTAEPAPTTSTTSSTVVDPLPPAAAGDLEAIYGDALAAVGMDLTDRGGLIDRSGGGYEPSGSGDHLALYVAPVGERSAQEYVDGIRDVAVVFDDVFERWPGLASFDVCQEPVDDDPRPGREPLPVTQIEVTKAEAAAIDWDTVTVLDLVRASQAEPPGLALRVSTGLRKSSAFEAIMAQLS